MIRKKLLDLDCSASSLHGAEWLLALPIFSYGLKLIDDAAHVVVSLRLLLAAVFVCLIHVVVDCGAPVDAQRLHGLIRKQAPSKVLGIVQSGTSSLGPTFSRYSASREPTGLTRLSGKPPDSLVLIRWQVARWYVSFKHSRLFLSAFFKQYGRRCCRSCRIAEGR